MHTGTSQYTPKHVSEFIFYGLMELVTRLQYHIHRTRHHLNLTSDDNIGLLNKHHWNKVGWHFCLFLATAKKLFTTAKCNWQSQHHKLVGTTSQQLGFHL